MFHQSQLDQRSQSVGQGSYYTGNDKNAYSDRHERDRRRKSSTDYGSHYGKNNGMSLLPGADRIAVARGATRSSSRNNGRRHSTGGNYANDGNQGNVYDSSTINDYGYAKSQGYDKNAGLGYNSNAGYVQDYAYSNGGAQEYNGGAGYVQDYAYNDADNAQGYGNGPGYVEDSVYDNGNALEYGQGNVNDSAYGNPFSNSNLRQYRSKSRSAQRYGNAGDKQNLYGNTYSPKARAAVDFNYDNASITNYAVRQAGRDRYKKGYQNGRQGSNRNNRYEDSLQMTGFPSQKASRSNTLYGSGYRGDQPSQQYGKQQYLVGAASDNGNTQAADGNYYPSNNVAAASDGNYYPNDTVRASSDGHFSAVNKGVSGGEGNYYPGDVVGSGSGGNYLPGDVVGSRSNGNYYPSNNRAAVSDGNYYPSNNRAAASDGNYYPSNNRAAASDGNYYPASNRGGVNGSRMPAMIRSYYPDTNTKTSNDTYGHPGQLAASALAAEAVGHAVDSLARKKSIADRYTQRVNAINFPISSQDLERTHYKDLGMHVVPGSPNSKLVGGRWRKVPRPVEGDVLWTDYYGPYGKEWNNYYGRTYHDVSDRIY
eukprot:gene1337-32694_t